MQIPNKLLILGILKKKHKRYIILTNKIE